MMNEPTRTLSRIIGSPLVPGSGGQDLVESEELLKYAFRNNVEMLYCRALEQRDSLNVLRDRYRELREREQITLRTVTRLSACLADGGIPHAVTKTLRPYPGTPNDVDCLYLGPLDKYEDVSRYLQARQYRLTGPNPMQYELFDETSGVEFNKDKAGGQFYIDLYRELAADHMPYMDSDLLRHEVVDARVEGFERPVRVLTTRAEMTVLALHSVLMHRIVPLEVIYTYAYLLAGMSEAEIRDMWAFACRSHAEPAMRTVLTVMEIHHRECFGTVPPQLALLVSLSGRRASEGRAFEQRALKMPHVVALMTFVVSVFSKTRGARARRGFFKELAHMANPLFAIEVLHHMLSKKYIDRHSDHV